jgi:hypothetical protein
MKKIILGILTLLFITSCKEYLSKKDLKYMPYENGDVLVFKNKKTNSINSIKVIRIHRYIPDGPQLHFNEVIRAEIEYGRFVSVHAGYGKHSDSYLNVFNVSRKFYIKNLKNQKMATLKIGTKELEDIIILESHKEIISKVKKIFWSMSKGIVKYETKSGMIWELKVE